MADSVSVDPGSVAEEAAEQPLALSVSITESHRDLSLENAAESAECIDGPIRADREGGGISAEGVPEAIMEPGFSTLEESTSTGDAMLSAETIMPIAAAADAIPRILEYEDDASFSEEASSVRRGLYQPTTPSPQDEVIVITPANQEGSMELPDYELSSRLTEPTAVGDQRLPEEVSDGGHFTPLESAPLEPSPPLSFRAEAEQPLAAPILEPESNAVEEVNSETAIVTTTEDSSVSSEVIVVTSSAQEPQLEPQPLREIDYVELHAPSHSATDASQAPVIFKHLPVAAQLASAVTLTKMIFILEKYRQFFRFDSGECFSIWKDFSLAAAISENKRLEQRIQKLKGLLARTHQARQRTLEDNTLSQQRARELLSSKARDETERNSLLQAIRAKEEETERERAFHYDMEILIQRAASEISSVPVTPLVSRHSRTQLDDLENDLMQARADLKDSELRLDRANLELSASHEKINSLMQELTASEEQRIAIERSVKALQAQLSEETNMRVDVERELKMLISRQGELASEIERKMKLRYDLRKIEVNEELEFTRSQLEKALFDLRTVETRQSEMRRELDSALSKLHEANRVLSENAQLKELLEEIKKTSFSQLSAAEQRHDKAAEIAADLVKVGLNATKNTVALETQIAELMSREKQVYTII